MMRNQGSDYLKYVYKADRIHVSADYRKDAVEPVQLYSPVHKQEKYDVASKSESIVERGQVYVEMDLASSLRR
ncbi:hypothetical protein RDI58_018053 [Solanum bulbocastanum]|uniref:Uncharacterized protein n=1 Tax=Solanum bulbocastanum TaxID=147425 RepID=A0AAN8TH91_SOLBU